MTLPPDLILAQVTDALAAPLPDADFAELLLRLAALERQLELLRSSPLQAEEPSLPPSLEEQP